MRPSGWLSLGLALAVTCAPLAAPSATPALGAAGTLYDLAGRTLSGPGAGAPLAPVVSYLSEWYGWSAYYPATRV